MKTTQLTLLVYLCLCMTVAFGQNTISIQAEKDNTLYEDPTGNLSNGIGDLMVVGSNIDGNKCRGLLSFDVANHIPSGAVISRVELHLNVTAATPGPRTVHVHKLHQNWGEGSSDSSDNPALGAQATSNDVTWTNTFYGNEDWNTPGGDFAADPSSSQSINSNGRYALPVTDQLIADVQGWLEDPTSNNGWVLIGDESVAETTKFISSREHTQPSNRPSLVVTYSFEVSLPPVADNTMYAESEMLSNGGGDFLFAGNSPDGMSRRALLKFDLSSIPSNATIRNAEISMHVSKGAREASEIALHRSMSNWGESQANAGGDEEGGAPSGNNDATWRFNFFNMNSALATEWNNEGGDFESVASATQFVRGPSNYFWAGGTIIDDVQNWLTDPSTNYGWILIGDESKPNTSARFISKDLDGSSAYPKLTITYDQNQTSLPVVMEKFQAMPKACEVEVSWVTHYELNNSGFYIERSSDLKSWEMIKEFEGHMQSADRLQYTFIDTEPNEGLNYYKVKQLDTDGATKYTQILSATTSYLDCMERKVSFFPNPTQDVLHFNMDGSGDMMARQLTIYNNLGQKMKTQMINKNQNVIDVSDLRPGMYFVTIDGFDSFTFIKEVE